MKVRSIAIILILAMVFSWGEVPAVHAEEIPDVTQYSYTVIPILAPFTYYLYVKTDNPDPTSFRLVDRECKYHEPGDAGQIRIPTNYGYNIALVDPGTYYIDQNLYPDVLYEDESTCRVHGGYIFRADASYSDGGELVLLQKSRSGDSILHDEFTQTEITVPCQPLSNMVDYLIDTYTTGEMHFFENLDAVQAQLSEIAVYPQRVYNKDDPNEDFPYPLLAASPYPELKLNEHYPMYNVLRCGILASNVYPFILDSFGFPGTIYAVAKQLEPGCEVASGAFHYQIEVTFEGETRSYGGCGGGGYDPLYSNRVRKVFSFQGGEDLGTNGTIEDFYELLWDYKDMATEDSWQYRDLITGITFDETIRATGGTWIRIAKESADYVISFGYAVPLGPDTMILEDAWVDGRYIGDHETIVLDQKFEDHPTADIVLHAVTYTDNRGELHTQDVIYKYDEAKDAWISPEFYTDMWYGTAWPIPEELILTREEVEAMVLDGNSSHLPEGGLVYDGTEYPGTPFTQKLVTGVSAPKTLTLQAGQSETVTAMVEPMDATDARVTWTSSDPSVAEIRDSATGIVCGIREGTADLTVITNDGRYTATCTVTVTPNPCETGHRWDAGTVTKVPTEEAQGVMTYECTACGESKTENIPILEHTHKHDAKVTEPTCTEKGYTTYTCTCGDSYVEDYVNAKGHAEAVDSAVAASCEAAGLTEGKHCDLCGEIIIKQEIVPVTGHSWEIGTVTKEPTENSEGVMTYQCTACGEVKTENIPVLEHIHKHDAKVTEPTCTEKGYTTYTCACGDSYVEDYVNAKGHAEAVDSAVAATCEAAGLTEGKYCSVCGEVITKQETIPAIGHSWSEGSCTVCGKEDPVYVQPTAPEESTDPEDTTEPEETTEPEDTTDISRLAGDNRFNTAFLVADQMKVNLGIDKFDAIIVASGTNFADALSGSYLAAVKNAPILLSFNDKYNELAKDYIWDNLTPGGTVYILGGTAAVPTSMEEGLENFNIIRLAGNDRFGTNLAILKEAGVADKDILVCTGLSFADSLSASASELPILLVWNKLMEDQKTFLDSLNGNKLYVIGGESAVSKDMEKKVAAYGETERVGGTNRFETSVNIAGKFFENPDSAVLAYAWNYPDGLCGGALAATMDAPLILTMDKYEARAAEYIQDKAIKRGFILGGETLISQDTVNTIFN